MTFLVDTHLLLWAAEGSPRLPDVARRLLEDEANTLLFSAASLWEVATKAGLGRADFQVHPAVLRHGLLAAGYEELPIAGDHAVAVLSLPDLHKDPFDRLLVAQAQIEGVTLLTSDPQVARYPGPIRGVFP